MGSSLMINLKGPKILKEERDLIIKEGIAGVILFQRNILSFQQLFELCCELKSLALKRKNSPYFFIAIDLEGGRVNRLAHLKDCSPWPSALEMSRLPQKKIFDLAFKKGRLLKALGLDINFAPVVDILLKNSSVLKTRSFGNQSEKVIANALAYSKGLLKSGVEPCLKHFPGHGGVKEDSHNMLPMDKRNIEDLTDQLNVFKTILKAPVHFVMTAHLEFPQVESGPATFSKVFLKQQLRNRLGFQGVIVSDDVDMKALEAFPPGERAFKALAGGCNLILCCQKLETPYEILEFFKKCKRKNQLQAYLKDSFLKLSSLKKETGKVIPWQKALEIVNSQNYFS